MTEVLEVIEDKDWETEAWFETVNDSTKTKKIASDDLGSEYVGNRNIFRRFANLIKGENICQESFDFRKIKKKTSTTSQVIVLRMMIITSIKSNATNANDSIEKAVEGYMLYVNFGSDEEEDGSIKCI